jgi:hypothetical protein
MKSQLRKIYITTESMSSDRDNKVQVLGFKKKGISPSPLSLVSIKKREGYNPLS